MWIEVKTTKGPIVTWVIYRHPTTLVNDYALPQIYVIFVLN